MSAYIEAVSEDTDPFDPAQPFSDAGNVDQETTKYLQTPIFQYTNVSSDGYTNKQITQK